MITLWKWDKGIAIDASDATCEDANIARRQPSVWAWPMSYYLMIYEWRLFGAFGVGQYGPGEVSHEIVISTDGLSCEVKSSDFFLKMKANEADVDLSLTVTNTTEKTWSELASIVPCMTPGDFSRESSAPGNRCFVDDAHERTFYLGEGGLDLLEAQEIHFAKNLASSVRALSPTGEFTFLPSPGPWGPQRWEMSEKHAEAGLLLRESIDRTWVAAIAWENFVSAQGHNPRRCLHLSVQVGPLEPSQSRTVRGKIYLFRGSKEECVSRFYSWRGALTPIS